MKKDILSLIIIAMHGYKCHLSGLSWSKNMQIFAILFKNAQREVFLELTKLCASNYQNSVVNVLLQMLKLLWQDMKRVVVCGAAQGKLLLITLNNKVLKHTNVVA